MKNIIVLITGLIWLCSCTPELVPYSIRIHQETGIAIDDLKKVQFYNSDRIVLFRELSHNATEITSGDIKIVDGKQVDEVVIKPGTPGILITHANDRFGIRFEKGSDRFLLFGLNPDRDGVYSLLAKNWGSYLGEVDYDGRIYQVKSESARAILLVNLKKINQLSVKSRTATGIDIK